MLKYFAFFIALVWAGVVSAEPSLDLSEAIKNSLVAYEDFPEDGIVFRDISPILENPDLFCRIIDQFYQRYEGRDVEAIVALEARGFLFGSTLAYRLKLPLVMVRKVGKLPGDVFCASYQKIYGVDTCIMRQKALIPGQRVVLVDDFYSTGGTLQAAADMVHAAGATVYEAAVVINNHCPENKKTLDFPVFALAELWP